MSELLDEIKNKDFDVLVIGTGFGGAVAITKLARKGKKVLALERGTWWGNPEGPGLKPTAKKFDLRDAKRQWWPRPNDSQGLVYLLDSIYKEVNPVRDVFDLTIKDRDLGPKKNRDGLYRLTRFSHRNGKVDVVSGSGVGGGSLFYSGVNLIPHKPVLDRIGLGHLTSQDFRNAASWMAEFRGKINKVNTKAPVPHRPGTHYQLAGIPESADIGPGDPYAEMPDPELNPYEEETLRLDRARVLKRAMERVVEDGGFVAPGGNGNSPAEVGAFKPLPLSVVEFDPAEKSTSNKKNAFCLREGRCLNGCLPSARHTLYKTIQSLVTKESLDVTVLPQTKVSHIDNRGADGKYVVHFESYLDDEDGEPGQVSCGTVFVGAGCLGTNEVMLRSKAKFEETGGREGLPLSGMTGQKFSTNGDFFAFTQGVSDLKGTPDSKRFGRVNPTAGPINSSAFHLSFDKGTDRRIDVHVEDAGVPSMFARLVHELLPALGNWFKLVRVAARLVRLLFNKDPFATSEEPDTTAREQESYQTERELLSDLFFFNLMGSGPDEPNGSFSIDDDGSGLKLEYDRNDKLADWKVFRNYEAVLEKLAKKMNGTLVKSPFWEREKRITVTHPLGGCPVGSDKEKGVVDHFGRVFDGSPGAAATETLKGLIVVDATAIPGALAANPTLTIVTHAVRSVEKALA